VIAPNRLKAHSPRVHFAVRDGLGRITLNRPEAINALNHEMVAAIDQKLIEWSLDDDIRVVLIDGAGERGLCAGGDVRMFHASARVGGDEARAFFRAEYRMNARISAYSKPVVAIMHGAVLGGGVGISAHASIRVVTDSTQVGMPEVSIGFVPDVGGSWLLSHAPGELGTHLALSAQTVGPSDAIVCDLADRYLPAAAVAQLRRVTGADHLLAAIESGAVEPPPSDLEIDRGWINECYSESSPVTIVKQLRNVGSVEAARVAALIESKSPTAVHVTLECLRRARELVSLEQALGLEYRVSCVALRSHDLSEGIRAQIIDRDRKPRWTPPSLAAVTSDDVACYFRVPEDGELRLDEPRSG
jgi:enoyl-CoA hydratase